LECMYKDVTRKCDMKIDKEPNDCTCQSTAATIAEAAKPKTVEKEEPVPITPKKTEEEPKPIAAKGEECFNSEGAHHACAANTQCLTLVGVTCPDNATEDCTCKKAKDLNAVCFNKEGAPLACVKGTECLTPALGTCPDKADKDCTCKAVIAEHKDCGGGADEDPLKCAVGFECKDVSDPTKEITDCPNDVAQGACYCIAPVTKDGECGPLTPKTHHLECVDSTECMMSVKDDEKDKNKPCDTEKAEKVGDCKCIASAYAWWVWALIALAGLLVIALAVCVICSCAGKKNNP